MIGRMDESQSSTPSQPVEAPISAAHARQRASAVMVAIGLAQLLPLGLTVLPMEMTAAWSDRSAWLVAVAIGGAVYVLTAVPVRLNVRAMAWLALAAAVAQALVFILLALLAIIAAISAGSPMSMTMGVLLFGTMASMHLFIARWLWPALQGETR